jgi:hypothetical protein
MMFNMKLILRDLQRGSSADSITCGRNMYRELVDDCIREPGLRESENNAELRGAINLTGSKYRHELLTEHHQVALASNIGLGAGVFNLEPMCSQEALSVVVVGLDIS